MFICNSFMLFRIWILNSKVLDLDQNQNYFSFPCGTQVKRKKTCITNVKRIRGITSARENRHLSSFKKDYLLNYLLTQQLRPLLHQDQESQESRLFLSLKLVHPAPGIFNQDQESELFLSLKLVHLQYLQASSVKIKSHNSSTLLHEKRFKDICVRDCSRVYTKSVALSLFLYIKTKPVTVGEGGGRQLKLATVQMALL